jgi:putative transposase
LRYVDMNPVRAQLVESAGEYPWSSAQAHITGRDPWGLLDHDLWREVCPLGDWDGVLYDGWATDSVWVAELRAATHSGKPLANQEFVKQLEQDVGSDLRVRGRGRPRKRFALHAAMGAAERG